MGLFDNTTAEEFMKILADATTGECISCKKRNPLNANGVCWECHEFHERTRNDYSVHKRSGYKKESIPEEIRWAVWERDNFTCQNCGSRKRLTVDHIYPEILGGETSMENCQTLCKKCNSSKGMKVL